ncbi:MAG: hypothetical protein KF689_14350 [Gemmatimonadaceae bacterium]|nr:hypothetical protein [Gemmatimonadaceae bacterium]
MRSEQPMSQQELATALCGRLRSRIASAVEFEEAEAFEHADCRVHRSVCGTERESTVPSPVGHLHPEEMVRDGLDARIVNPEMGQDGEHHPCDARFALVVPSVVDTAVLPEPGLE